MSNFYDSIANNYKKISLNKQKYISSVDKLVIKHLKNKNNILDVGSGDGIRLERIKRKLKNKSFVAIEPSKEMYKLFKKNSKIKIYNLDLNNLDKLKNPYFDGITCLWNVFGHLKNNKKRILALKKIKTKMSSSSIFLTDVNNRHNALSYGYLEVFKRLLIDFFSFDEKRGDTKFNFKINGKRIKANGHLFTNKEFSNNLIKAGFEIIKIYSINYKNGKVMNSFLNGQLLYIAKIKQ